VQTNWKRRTIFLNRAGSLHGKRLQNNIATALRMMRLTASDGPLTELDRRKNRGNTIRGWLAIVISVLAFIVSIGALFYKRGF